ncbi:MAG TPA: hypothetical protein VNC50_16910 [Planctomycetia bacterium]|nr:hypothetical protein [Planctomycetia bacterium]
MPSFWLAALALLFQNDSPPKANPKTELRAQAAARKAAPKPADKYLESIQLGADWLARQQLPDGPFRYGWIPALDRPLPGNHPLRQAGAAAALAIVGREFNLPDHRKQAALAATGMIAAWTEPDRKLPGARRPSLSPTDANPVGFTALLLWAASELAPSETELVAPAEELAKFLVSRQRKDGTFNVANSYLDDGDDPPLNVAYYPGQALFALLKSHRAKPADWKLAAVRNALPKYRQIWADNPHEAMAPWLAAAATEFFFITGDKPAGDFALLLGDWSLALQHREPKDKTLGWYGGFGSYHEGRLLATEPGITSASFLEGIGDAYRVARQREDRERMATYRAALDAGAEFLLSTQFTVGRTSHFNPAAAKRVRGGFWASLTDGALRIDQNQHALRALSTYWLYGVAGLPPDGRGPRSELQAN